MGIKIGVCGVGRFAPGFVLLFQHHPLVEEVVLADVQAERLKQAQQRFSVKRAFASLDELCQSDVDAVALFTQRHLHGEQAIQALNAGKHVYSAVPPAMDMDVLRKLVQTVERSGLHYMSGETSLYYPWTLYCQKRYANGDFGRFVYAEAQYMHDMQHMYGSYKSSGGDQWKRVAGVPPMYYPTHSVSMPLAVTGARVTHVSCMGLEDNHPDGIFGPGANDWDNPFSNESALMRTTDGGVMRINEMRRVGWASSFASVHMRFYGSEAAYEQHASSACWVTRDPERREDLTEAMTLQPDETVAGALGEQPRQGDPQAYPGTCSLHPTDRLPDAYRGLPNGHLGSHAFLVDDFVSACANDTTPPGHIHDAANWCAAGLVAHESALQGGAMLEVPDFTS